MNFFEAHINRIQNLQKLKAGVFVPEDAWIYDPRYVPAIEDEHWLPAAASGFRFANGELLPGSSNSLGLLLVRNSKICGTKHHLIRELSDVLNSPVPVYPAFTFGELPAPIVLPFIQSALRAIDVQPEFVREQSLKYLGRDELLGWVESLRLLAFACKGRFRLVIGVMEKMDYELQRMMKDLAW